MKSQSRRVAIIGMGSVGATAAYATLLQGTASSLVLYSREKNKAIGEKLDLEHGLSFMERAEVIATDNFADLRDTNVVVITSGVAQKPGQTRLDLVNTNLKIIEDIVPQIVIHAPQAVIILVSNPVDILTFRAQQIARLPAGRVFGSGTMLDTARFRFHLAESLNLNSRSIHAYILGEHGDSSFPVLSSATIGGQPLSTYPGYSEQKALEIYHQVQQAAQNIIAAKGSTYYAIGVVIAQLVKTVLQDSRSVLPVSVPLTNYYGVSNIALSVPCIVGAKGVEQILTPPLSPQEQQSLRHSAEVLTPFISQN